MVAMMLLNILLAHTAENTQRVTPTEMMTWWEVKTHFALQLASQTNLIDRVVTTLA